MFRSAIVPVDGSPMAERAVPWALMAAAGGAVELMHVHVSPAPLVVEGVVVADPKLDETLRAQEAEYLTTLTERAAAAAPGVVVTTENVDTDDALSEAVATAVADRGAELVVMSTHGRGAWTRFLLGSVTDETVRYSPVPVLVVRSDEDGEAPVDLTVHPVVKNVIVTLDGSDLAEKIVPTAARLAKALSVPVTLLAVVDSAEHADSAFGPAGEKAETYLGRIAAKVTADHAVTPTRLVRPGSPVDVIAATSAEVGGGIVALATHGRAGLSRLFHGSVADDVIRTAAGPVLVFHPPE